MKKILITLLLVTLTGCSTLQNELKSYVKQPKVSYQSIALGEVSTSEIELLPRFKIINTNDFSIPVNSIDYQLSLNNKTLLEGETDAIGTLPANADKELNLSIKLTQESLSSLKNILLNEKKIAYQIEGTVNTLGMTIPFEKSAVLFLPELKIGDLQVKSATFEEVTLLLNLEIENLNDFSIPLDSVRYGVSSAGKELFTGGLSNQKISHGKNSIEVPLSIKPSDLFSNIFSLLLDPQLPLSIEIETPFYSKSFQQRIDLSLFMSNQ
ncbi:hypothetical protein CW745_06065 [Psychromonas sp. psych-6C06]|uniref:LEA type 2 family protein n=1 Tax=Psychromonas sp. psych-6C06 TaxID=2058089 RepID=UPI000C31C2C6|nr:LEA type 2 family protein [Psychromonas sp. psych-6C06]PKF62989.1 hypothetical protein CW745_06065 [Psychromonas sp. psych-6C06]